MQPSITLGQKEEIVKVVTDAVRKAIGVTIDELGGVLNKETSQRVIAGGNRMVAAVTATVKQVVVELAENVVGILKLISGEEIEISATDGTETLAQASDVFTGWVDSDFESWGTNVPGKPTAPAKAQVLEQVKDGDFRTIFNIPGRDLDSLCFEQSQIKAFARDHAKWLHPDGWATFFLFKVGEGDKKKFFVARVNRYAGELKVSVHRFGHVSFWSAESRFRVVLPQLPSAPPES